MAVPKAKIGGFKQSSIIMADYGGYNIHMGVYYIHCSLLCLCMHHCLIIALVYKYSAMMLSCQMFSTTGLLNMYHSSTFVYFQCTNTYKTCQGHTST